MAARRRQVAFVTARGLSQRRACRLLSLARSSLAYVSRLEEPDAPVLEAMRELARQYPRYGYRRIQVFLARRGFELNLAIRQAQRSLKRLLFRCSTVRRRRAAAVIFSR